MHAKKANNDNRREDTTSASDEALGLVGSHGVKTALEIANRELVKHTVIGNHEGMSHWLTVVAHLEGLRRRF